MSPPGWSSRTQSLGQVRGTRWHEVLQDRSVLWPHSITPAGCSIREQPGEVIIRSIHCKVTSESWSCPHKEPQMEGWTAET